MLYVPVQEGESRQPRVPLINVGNPIARSAFSLLVGSATHDLVSGGQLSTLNMANNQLRVGKHGVAFHPKVDCCTFGSPFALPTAFTVAMLLEQGVGSYPAIASIRTHGSTDYDKGFFLEKPSANVVRAGLRLTDYSRVYLDFDVTSLGYCFFICTYSTGSFRVWLNGALVGELPVSTLWRPNPAAIYLGASSGSYSSDPKIYFATALRGVLNDEGVASLFANPWQMCKPLTYLYPVPVFINPDNPPQILVPTSDITKGDWLASTGSDLYSMLDESTIDESDYIVASSQTYCEVRLATGVTPSVRTGHIIRYQLQSTNAGIRVSLKQGATTIVQWDHYVVTSASFEQTLTEPQANLITDYADLRMSFEVIP